MVHTCVEESADAEYVHEYRLNHGCKRAVHEYVSDCKRAHSGPSVGLSVRSRSPQAETSASHSPGAHKPDAWLAVTAGERVDEHVLPR